MFITMVFHCINYNDIQIQMKHLLFFCNDCENAVKSQEVFLVSLHLQKKNPHASGMDFFHECGDQMS